MVTLTMAEVERMIQGRRPQVTRPSVGGRTAHDAATGSEGVGMISRHDPAARGGIGNLVAPGAVALVLAASTLFAVSGIREADQQHAIAHAAAGVRAELNHLSALENGAEAGEEAPPDEIDEALAALHENLDLALTGLPSDESASVRETTEQFGAAAAFTARAYSTGDIEEADAVDDEEADPLFESLTLDFKIIEDRATQRANRSASNATRGLTVSSIAAGLAIVIVIRAEGRSRSRRSLRQARAELSARYQGLIENSPIHLYVVGSDGSIDFVSPSAVESMGWRVTHVQELLDLLAPADLERLRGSLVTQEGPFDRPETVQIRGTSQWYEVTVADHRANPVINGLVITGRDVTDRIELETTLRRQAREDELTGLLNRRALNEVIIKALARSARGSTTTALLLIDLDGFKGINDTLGHPVGDALLAMAAERLATMTRVNETVARLGGDEFALVAELTETDPIGEAERAASRYLEALRAPYTIDGQALTIDASIGIAIAPDTTDSDTLLRYADIALYEAKHAGGSCTRLFAPEMEDLLLVQTRLHRGLEAALDKGEFSLAYQPLISIADGRPTGFEALLRWESPELGKVSPATFIPAAEHSGAICRLGRWVLDEAVRQLTEWQQQFDDDRLTMSVNASVVELVEGGYVTHLAEILDETGLDPSTLQIEVTESVLADDHHVVAEVLEAIRALGVRIALDDFGTGYSSMNQLQKLPIDCLKIDRAFIHSMTDNDRSTSVVHALIELGKALGLQTIAEGIETPEQLDALKDPECDLAQGFFFARPMSASAIRDFMATSESVAPAGFSSTIAPS